MQTSTLQEVSIQQPSRARWTFPLLVCLFAGVRIWFFCAAFPFFTNIDEHGHFDLIWKYAHGTPISLKTQAFDNEVFRYTVLFDSPEYLEAQSPPDEVAPARILALPQEVRETLFAGVAARRPVNHEQFSPPLYYWLASKWLLAGQMAGFKNAGLLYWTRFLNVPIYLALMALVLVASTRLAPHIPHVRFGLPILVAALPQDVFYSINSDVLSPIFGTLAFLLVYEWTTAATVRWYIPAALGISLAGAVLVKTSNAPIAAIAVLPPLIRAWKNKSVRLSRAEIANVAILGLCAALPLIPWIASNLGVTGDLSGSRIKVEQLGWTSKPLADLLPHPILSFSGITYFFHHLLASFWRGELVWHTAPIALSWLDAIYSATTLVFLGAAAAMGIGRLWRRNDDGILFVCTVGWVAFVAFFLAISVMFDFHDCRYPSRALPFLISGRLMLPVVVPVMAAYISGLTWLLKTARAERFTLVAIASIGVVVTIAEVALHGSVYGSLYNFFHIPLTLP